MISAQQLQSELDQCTGTEHYYRGPLNRYKFTDGVHIFADKAGAVWLLTDIALFLSKSELQNQEFLCIVLKVKDQKADLIFEDGNDKVLFKRHYSFTDCPEGDWKLYFIDNVLLLPSEY